MFKQHDNDSFYLKINVALLNFQLVFFVASGGPSGGPDFKNLDKWVLVHRKPYSMIIVESRRDLTKYVCQTLQKACPSEERGVAPGRANAVDLRKSSMESRDNQLLLLIHY
jgi:hypothetical protein